MILDTNVLIDYFKAKPRVVVPILEWRTRGYSLAISSISRAEVLSWPSLQARSIIEYRTFLDQFVSLPTDDRIADIASLLRRKYRSLKLPDALIAATAMHHQLPLVTQDRDFRIISELEVIDLAG